MPRSEKAKAPLKSNRLPPNQAALDELRVLTYGPTPKIDLAKWRFGLFGLVEKETELTWEQFQALPKTKLVADFHCGTQWSVLDNTWEGVTPRDIAALARPAPRAKFVMVHCFGGYTTNLSLDDFMQPDVLFAYRRNGKELPLDNGWPLRLIVPKLYAWKSAKWVSGLEYRASDAPGFYESRGYNNRGDPWKDERFWPDLQKDFAITLAICGTPEVSGQRDKDS